MIPVDASQSLYHAAREPKELWIVDQASHGRAWPVAKEEYEQRVVTFFQRHLRHP